MAKTDGKPASVKPAELRQMVAPAGVKSIITRQTMLNWITMLNRQTILNRQTMLNRQTLRSPGREVRIVKVKVRVGLHM